MASAINTAAGEEIHRAAKIDLEKCPTQKEWIDLITAWLVKPEDHPEMIDQEGRTFWLLVDGGMLELAKECASRCPIELIWIQQAFQTACCRGHLEMAQWLFAKEPAINRCKYGLAEAAGLKQTAIVQWLLETEPKFQTKPKYASLAFLDAVEVGEYELAKMIYISVPTLDIYQPNYSDHQTAAQVLTTAGTPEALELLRFVQDFGTATPSASQ